MFWAWWEVSVSIGKNQFVLDMEPAGFPTDSLQYTAKYASEDDGTSVETHFLKSK